MAKSGSRPAAARSAAAPAAPAMPVEVLRLAQAQQLLARQRSADAEAVLDSPEAVAQPWRDPRWQAERRFLLAVAGLGRVPATPPADAADREAVTALLDRCLDHAQAAVQAQPTNPRYAMALGRAWKAAGHLDPAEAAYRSALALEPDYAEAWVSLGILLRLRGKLDAASQCHHEALRIAPAMSAARANLANVQAELAEQRLSDGFDGGIDDETLDEQGRAVALEPHNPVLHRNYGLLLMRARRHREAMEAFNETLRLDPGDLDACLRFGKLLAAFGQASLATEAYEKWLAVNPPQAPVLRALAAQLTRGGQTDRAIGYAEQAVQMARDPQSLLTLGTTRMQMRDLPASLTHLREAIDRSGRSFELYPSWLLGLSYLHEDAAMVVDAHAEFGQRLGSATERRAAGPRPPQLKVGFVSGDFVRHSVSYFLAGWLAHHDRERFHFTGYHNNPVEDEITEYLKAGLDAFVPCDTWSDDALERRIRADGIDVLIDLSGHTAGTRVHVFARGAAPLQIGYLGYPTVSGVPAIDLRLTDCSIDPGDLPHPPGHDRPWPLLRSMFCYRPSDDAPPPAAEPPSAHAGQVTFGSFNNIAKLSDRTLALWAAAMRAVPGSRLLLKSPAMAQAGNRAGIERTMASHGVAAERLHLVAWLPDKNGHLGLYDRVDVALDPYPYNGATTTCEALWMGVPVVSLRGASHTARMGASLLDAAGRPEWVAHTEAQFVAIARDLAADEAGRRAWRRGGRLLLEASALRDEIGFVRAFEGALDAAWDWKTAQCKADPRADAGRREAASAGRTAPPAVVPVAVHPTQVLLS